MTRAVIVSAVRTPFGRLGGGLAGSSATELGAVAISGALERAGIDPGEVGYVVMGQVLQAGAGQAPARQAAVAAGIPKEVPADTINKVCASSIRAIEIADLMIRDGRHDVVVTGGMESMSNAPYLLPHARFGYRLGNGELVDHMVFDGLTSTFDGDHMVVQASRVSRELGISREAQDAWAARSHARAAAAEDDGRLAEEIVPVGEVVRDESIRRDTTVEKLASLKPVFDPEGTTTAGNAPGVNDGASAVVLCSEAFARSRGLEVLATVLGHATVADDFAYLARTPAKAGALALEAAGRIAGRRRARGDQRGLRLGGEQFDPDARGRGGDRERQRRRHRARPSNRRLGRPDRGNADPRAPAFGRWARSRRDLLRRRTGRRPVDRVLIRLALIGLAALLLTGSAQAFTCPSTPLEQRISEAEAVFVGRSSGFTGVPGEGIPQRVYRFEVDQEVKGDFGRTVDVRIPVKPENGGQLDPPRRRSRSPDEPRRRRVVHDPVRHHRPRRRARGRGQAAGKRDQAADRGLSSLRASWPTRSVASSGGAPVTTLRR